MNLFPDNCHPYTFAAGWLPGKKLALVNVSDYKSEDDYVKRAFNDKARQKYNKAKRMGYVCTVDDYIYRNEKIGDILAINQSKQVRQGREMHDSYNHPQPYNRPVYCDNHHFKLILCLKDETIVGYLEFYIVGDFSQTSRILGHADYLNDGIMYLIFAKAFEICKSYNCKYFCYGEWYSGGEGLIFFKHSTGFHQEMLIV